MISVATANKARKHTITTTAMQPQPLITPPNARKTPQRTQPFNADFDDDGGELGGPMGGPRRFTDIMDYDPSRHMIRVVPATDAGTTEAIEQHVEEENAARQPGYVPGSTRMMMELLAMEERINAKKGLQQPMTVAAAASAAAVPQ